MNQNQNKIEWHKVTWYSKILAGIILLGALPVLTFYIGAQYEETVQSVESTSKPSTIVITSNKEDLTIWNILLNNCSDNNKKMDTSSPESMSNCAEKEQRRTETEMNQLYTRVLSYADNMAKGEDTQTVKIYHQTKDLVVAAQTAFINYRDKECESESKGWISLDEQPIFINACKANLNSKRIDSLQFYLEAME